MNNKSNRSECFKRFINTQKIYVFTDSLKVSVQITKHFAYVVHTYTRLSHHPVTSVNKNN